MKASRNLQLLLLLPVSLVVLFALLFIYGSLSSVKTQYDLASAAQTRDLLVIEDAARFSHDIGQVQRQMATALEGAQAGILTELQLYRMHSVIVDDLDALGRRVRQLADSELVIDANHDSARGLLDEFESYRRFVIMSTDVIAVNPAVAVTFMEQAQRHFREFSIFSSRIVSLLSERSQQRNIAQGSVLSDVYARVLFLGFVALALLLAITYMSAHRASARMLDIADALSTLAHSEGAKIPLPAIEKMHHESKGEFGRIAATLLTFRNEIERRRHAEEEAFQLAFYDPLTQLPNRRLLRERLHHASMMCDRLDSHAAVLILDLDEFKRINDSRGHAFGDKVLTALAKRLKLAVGENNTLAHLGGDSFAILVESLATDAERAAKQVERYTTRILAKVDEPIQLDDEELRITVSTGIALFDKRTEDLDNPLKHAESAMYQAKAAGRQTFRFYDPDMQTRLEARILLENELRLAVERDQLRLFYQIQVDETDVVRGVEALIRWEHPDKGLMPPLTFIPIAEDSGLILQIGRWVLRTACEQLKHWEADPRCRELSIAVNVSARQFRQDDFVAEVLAVLAETGADSRRLKLELTESTVLENIETTIEHMQSLRAAGLRFSMDDFGTGYSSLQYLKRLPLDQIKIDQSFVRDIIIDANDLVIVQTIIAMSHALGLDVIAEGVETREQRDLLFSQGCKAFQGYLFGKPEPLYRVDALLAGTTPTALTSSTRAVAQPSD